MERSTATCRFTVVWHYDMEYLQNVYIAGDGAPWIVAGCGILEKSKFVLDKFHLWKYIQKATKHLLDSAEDARELIYGYGA